MEAQASSRIGESERARFREAGFVVLRAAFDPRPLSIELDRALQAGLRGAFRAEVGGSALFGRYLPMMCERTPVSLALIDRFLPVAEALVGRRVLPSRAKGVVYFAETAWHTDSELPIAGASILAYLEPLAGANGALCVVPGSHRVGTPVPAKDERGVAVETSPGDVIVMDEHLYHASRGGTDRRQWRIDYVIDPRREDVAETERVREYFRRQYSPDWDGGYDVDLFPSYGAHWQASGRAWVERLRELGAYAAAAEEETSARSDVALQAKHET